MCPSLRVSAGDTLGDSTPPLQVNRVTLGGRAPEELPFRFDGDTNTALVVPLPNPVGENESVTVTLAPADAAGRVRVTVDDQGPGIPPAERERIWERFWRLERDRGSAVAGTGIGLAVVRELAALHRGRAWIEDPPGGHGGGARFVLEVPAAAPPAAPPAAERSAPAEATA